jgi:hypothetical protein
MIGCSLAVMSLSACAALPTHNTEPKSCRERSAFALAKSYPDPNNLITVLNAICPTELPEGSP